LKCIDVSVEKIVNILTLLRYQFQTNWYDIAKTSAHGDESIAAIVQEAFIKAGEFGIVSHKRSFYRWNFIEHIAGNPLDADMLTKALLMWMIQSVVLTIH
jgi:hypothetical protein